MSQKNAKKDFRSIAREEVVSAMREVLSDPDAGLELTSGFTKRLEKSVQDKEENKVATLSEAFKEYGF